MTNLSTHTHINVIGLTENGLDDLDGQRRALIARASYIFGGQRHLQLVKSCLNPQKQHIIPWPHPFHKAIEEICRLRESNIVVLASGNPFFFGVGRTLVKHLPRAELTCFPAPSSISFACSRLGWAQEETRTLSLCGRSIEKLRAQLQPNVPTLILCTKQQTPHDVFSYLKQYGFSNINFTLLENLGGPNETQRTFGPGDALPRQCAPLSILAFIIPAQQAPSCLPLSDGLDDTLFVNDGQLTRQEIRALTLCALAPRAGQYLWDIGAGAGSISIEWLLKHPRNCATAVEHNPQRAQFIRRNSQNLGVPDIDIVLGRAPEILEHLPTPDAIFIGGGLTRTHLLETAWQRLKKEGRLVCNGVTLETQILLAQAQQHFGGTIRRFQIDRLAPLGHFRKLEPALNILQWIAIKHDH